MTNDDRQKYQLSKLARRFGTVATAAAALLADDPVRAHESEVLKGLLNRNDVVAAQPTVTDAPAELVPPPLILKPSHSAPNWILAGHRSHSSHSSHRSHSSHVSGSSHSSHFSSSAGTSFRRSSPRGRSGSSTNFYDSPSTAPDPPARSSPAPPVDPPPAPKEKAGPDVDRNNPLFRYQLITISNTYGIQKAFIKDLLLGNASLIKVGETIGDCTLLEISIPKQAIRLKPTTGPEFTIKRNQATH